MSSTAQELLQGATQVHAVGPRLAPLRRIGAFLLFASIWTGVGVTATHLARNAFSIPQSSVYAPLTAIDLAPISVTNVSQTISLQSPWLGAMFTGEETVVSVSSFSPIERFQDVILDESISFEAAKNLFEQLDLSPEQALEVYLNLGYATDAYVISGAIANPQDVVLSQQKKSMDWLNQVWEKGDNDWSTIPSPQLSADIISANPQWETSSDDDKWSIIQTLWNRRTTSTLFKVEHTATTDLTAQEARQYLQQTVDEVGLAAVVVPFMLKEDPRALISLAHQLQKANQEVERTTGLKGKVLGINHRVILDNSNMDQTAYVKNNDAGYILMMSGWDSFAHEWYHSFDLSVRQSYIRTKSPQALDALHAIDDAWSEIENPSITPEQRRAIGAQISSFRILNVASNIPPEQKALFWADNSAVENGVPSKGSPWVQWRHDAVRQIKWHDYKAWFTQTHREKYLSSRYELMAFAFEGHHQSQHQTDKNGVSFSAEYFYSPSYQPTPIESAAQKPTWDKVFLVAQRWWAQDQLERDPSHPQLLSGSSIAHKRVAPTPAAAALKM